MAVARDGIRQATDPAEAQKQKLLRPRGLQDPAALRPLVSKARAALEQVMMV